MPVKALCPNPNCGASYSIAPSDVGRMGICRNCGTRFEMGADSTGPGRDDSMLLGEPDPPSVPKGSLGSQFGRYKIIKKLGQGGMGAVYLAYDDKLDRPVALKMPHFDLGSGPEVVGRFLREARAAAAFHHPNFCPIYDVGEIEGSQFLAMAYVEGETLGSLVDAKRPMEPRKAAETARQLALALAEAHRRGIVHRDLKPSNVMIDARGTLIIMDFGVARRMGTEDVEWTKSGALLGTPHYMAPEQVRGDKMATGPAIDIYALGVILYQLMTGRRPFEGPVSLVLGLIAVQEPPAPSTHVPGLDRDLEAICLKAMAKRIEDRYASMELLAGALAAYLARPEPAARPRPEPVAPAVVEKPARPLREDTLPPVVLPTPDRPAKAPSRLVPVLATVVILLGVLGAAGFALVQSGVIHLAGTKADPKAPDLAAATGPKVDAVAPPGPATKPPEPKPAPVDDAPPAKKETPFVPIVKGDEPPPPPQPEPVRPPAPVQPPAPEPVQPPATAPTPAPDPRKDALPAFNRGTASLDRKDYDGAVAAFDEAIRIDPRNADTLDGRARARMGLGDLDRALGDLDRAIAIDPKHADAHDNRGQIYLARKQYDRAIEDFRRALHLDPDHTRAYLNRGIAFQAKGDHDRAIADFTEDLDNLDDEKSTDDARRARALYHRGKSHLALNDLPKAISDMEAAIRLDPKLADAYVDLGCTDLAVKEYDKAIVNFRKAVKLDQDHGRAHMNLGVAYQAKGDHERAIASFTESLDNDPGHAQSLVDRAESRNALQRYDQAIEDCDAALRINPRLADAYDVRGIARYQLRDYDRAILDFTSATQFDSKHPNAYEGRGLCHLARKDYPRAVADLDSALRIEPEDTSANSVLASILASCPDDAVRDGARALTLATLASEKLNWKDAYALNSLAEAHAELGQFPQAVARQTEAIDLLRDEPTRANYRSRLRAYQDGQPYRFRH